MLTSTFCHIPGVGAKTERRLWSHGVLSWDDAGADVLQSVLPGRSDAVRRLARESGDRLSRGDALYFYERLPSNQHWRLFPNFRGSVAYLDIETTGLGSPSDYITVIGLYDGQSVRQYVFDENLDEFERDVRDFQLVVTYNGKQFDLPFIRHSLGLHMAHAHIDLRYVLASLGYKGGLKGCEKQLGIDRGDLDGVDGYFAVLLWRDFRHSGNRRALETLLAYNAADVVNLEALMVMAYNMKARALEIDRAPMLTVPSPPALPFGVHQGTLDRIRLEHGWL